MIVQKYDEKEKKYVQHTVPNSWRLLLVSDNMYEKINCVNCGKQIIFGHGYTSHRYHNHMGFGYFECEECYYDYMPIYMKHKGEITC